MSEFHAEARVNVVANTAPFRAQLTEALAAAEKLVASVKIVPDVKGFAAALKAELATIPKFAHVNVVPDFATFKESVIAGVTASSQGIPPIGVKVIPDTKTFRQELIAQTIAASAGLSVPVTVVPKAGAVVPPTGAPGAAAAETESAKRATSSSKEKKLQEKILRETTLMWNLHEEQRTAKTIAEQEERTAVHRAAETARRQESAKALKAGLSENAALLAAQERETEAARKRAATAATRVESAELFKGRGKSESARLGQEASRLVTAQEVARRAHAAALLTEDKALQKSTASTLRHVTALQLSKTAAYNDAAAQEADARALAKSSFARDSAARGAVGQAATFAGLRGAVLSASGGFIAGTIAMVAFGKAVQSASAFASDLNVFRVVAGATADEMERVSKVSQELGADITLPAVAASDAAQAISQLAKAGLSVEDSLAGARGVLQLATAAQIDNARAVELTASALNAFGLSGDQAVRVADVLTNAANASQSSIEDMGIAFQQSSAVARQVGVSFEDTVALLTLLGRAGIRGSDAGTSLRVAFTRLTAPTKEAAKVLRDLNVQVLDTAGRLRPEVFREIADSMGNLSVSAQNANAKIIFGVDALRAYSIASRATVDQLDGTRDALEREGSAAELAAARMTGLTGAAERAKNQLATLGLTFGKLATGPLTLLADMLAETAQNANTLAGALVRAAEKAKAFGKDVSEEVPGGSFIGDKLKAIAKEVIKVQVFGPTGAAIITVANLVDDEKIEEDLSKVNVRIRDGIERWSQQAKVDARSFGDVMAKAINDAIEASIGQADRIIQAAANKAIAATTKALNQMKGLEDAFNQVLLAGGGPSAQIAELDRQAATQQTIIDKAEGALAGLTSKDKGFATLTERLRAARSKLVSIQGQRQSIMDGVAADAKKAADEAQDKLNKADQAVLDALAPATRRLDTRALIAEGTVQLQDNIKVAKAQIANNKKRIAVILAQFNDKKKAQALVADIKDDNIRLNQQITEDTAAMAASGGEAFAARLSLAEAEGNIPKQIALQKRRIAQINELIATGKAEGAALDKLKTERAQRLARIEELQDQKIRSEIALGESILELTGNKNPVLRALNKAIAETRADIKAAKKAGKSTTDLETELNNFLINRKNVLEDATDKAQGTTAFDLLKQFTDVFNQSAGNLIGPDQPFASASDFTDDMSKWLVKKPGSGKGGITPKPGGKSKLELNDDRLVRSMDDLTTAFSSSSSTIQKMFTVGNPKGMLTPGNINLRNRPQVPNPKGGVSTVLSFSVPAKEIGLGLGEVLLPQVVKGQIVSRKEAIEHARKTGQHLGVFKTPDLADQYARALHIQQQRLGGTRGMSSTDSKLDRLSTALDRNTNALTGNTTTTKKATPKPSAGDVVGMRYEAMAAYYARQSKIAVEG